MITTMLVQCKGQTFHTEGNKLTGAPDIERSFSQQAADAIRLLGPQDCTYEEGYRECGKQCSPLDILSVMNANSTVDGTNNAYCVDSFFMVHFQRWNGCVGPKGEEHNENHRNLCWQRYAEV